MSDLNSLLVSSSEFQIVNDLQSDSFFEQGFSQSFVDTADDSWKSQLSDFDYALLFGKSALGVADVIKRRSVGSHFLKYIDFVHTLNGELWGESLFSLVFKETLLKSIKNQDFKGAVIFLGESPLAFPVIDVLASFGFEEFVFLKLQDDSEIESNFDFTKTGLINVKISYVNSGDFIQSQKEYSFCFVMEESYPDQVLEDMSYFHFLSSQSIVYDLVGKSNFLFKEVRALGVNLTEFKTLSESWLKVLRRRVQALKAGS